MYANKTIILCALKSYSDANYFLVKLGRNLNDNSILFFLFYYPIDFTLIVAGMMEAPRGKLLPLFRTLRVGSEGAHIFSLF